MGRSEVAQSCLTLCDPMDCSLSGSSVHGIFQARVLEWVAITCAFSFLLRALGVLLTQEVLNLTKVILCCHHVATSRYCTARNKTNPDITGS